MTNTMNYPVCDQCDCVAGCSKNPEPCPILLAECIASGQVSAQQIEAHRAAGEIHSCSLYCDRLACVKAQRDELRAQLEAVGAGGVSSLMPLTVQPAKGLFVDMIASYGQGFEKEVLEAIAQPQQSTPAVQQSAAISITDSEVGTFERQYLIETMPTRKALELFLKRRALAAINPTGGTKP